MEQKVLLANKEERRDGLLKFIVAALIVIVFCFLRFTGVCKDKKALKNYILRAFL
jgi:hypothetical protein